MPLFSEDVLDEVPTKRCTKCGERQCSLLRMDDARFAGASHGKMSSSRIYR